MDSISPTAVESDGSQVENLIEGLEPKPQIKLYRDALMDPELSLETNEENGSDHPGSLQNRCRNGENKANVEARYPPRENPYTVAIDEVPVTVARVPYIPQKEHLLVDAGTARAIVAASKERPNGTTENGWARRHQNKTVVQQHVEYWDKDQDGVIWPQDTYNGCRDFGWSIILSLIAALFINIGLSYPTCPTIIPDPFFRIYVNRLHRAKHGSDSMSFDNEGRFRPQMFEDFFSKYDRGNKGGLDARDLVHAIKGQMLVFDLFGWTAVVGEWLATYLLLWPEDGILRKEDVRRVFDGSIFQHKADQYAEKQRKLKLR